MALTKYTGATNTIQNLSDRPNQNEGLTAAQLKLKFDQAAIDNEAYLNDVLTVEVDTLNAENVKKTGDQTIAGVKTFSSSPIVPTPTTDMQASTKKYVDDVGASKTNDLNAHKSSNDHDGRYYTETEVNNLISPLESKTNITNNRKLSDTGNFTGSWFGVSNPALADPGIAGVVEQHTSQLADIAVIPSILTNTDITSIINTIIANMTTGKIKIPSGTFIIDAEIGISLKSNMSLELSDNTVLQVKTTSNTNYSAIKVYDCDNVKISGGKIIGDRTTHIGTTGEWGFGIDVRGSSNVTIRDIKVNNCWGDGIYLGSTTVNGKFITIDNVNCDNNRRQGMSIVGCDNVVVTNSTFQNTNGTSPEAGIDIEPNTGTLNNIQISNCKFLNNNGGGVDVLTSKNVNVSSNYFEGNKNGIDVVGVVNRISECIINNNKFYNNDISCINISDYTEVFISNNTFDKLTTLTGGMIYFNGVVNYKRVEIENNKFINDGKYNFRWNNTDTVTLLIIKNNKFFIYNDAYGDTINGSAKSIFEGNDYILDNSYVLTNAITSIYALYFATTGILINNCSFNNNSTNLVKLGAPTVVTIKNCTFTQYFTFVTSNNITLAKYFHGNDYLNAYDTTKLPDSFNLGEETTVINGDTNLPSTSKQGILKTIVPTNLTGYRKFIVQWYYPANNGDSLSDMYFRKANSATNDWSVWKKLSGV